MSVASSYIELVYNNKLMGNHSVSPLLEKLIIFSGFVLILNIWLFPSVYSDSINPSLFAKGSSPYGTSTTDWTIKWWQWLIGVPKDKNPMLDKTGINCAENQKDPNVWFITGNQGGKDERTCKVPAGKAIFFGHGYECSTFENPELTTYEQLRNCAVDQKNKILNFIYEVRLDGVPLRDLTSYEEISPPFNVYFPPPEPIWSKDGKVGTSPAAADTYFVFIKPLPKGDHVFEVSSINMCPGSGDVCFTMDVKYNLIVE